jgi:hypothetical protein
MMSSSPSTNAVGFHGDEQPVVGGIDNVSNLFFGFRYFNIHDVLQILILRTTMY